MTQVFQVFADRVQLAADRPQCLLDHRGYFFADDVANILLRHHPVFDEGKRFKYVLYIPIHMSVRQYSIQGALIRRGWVPWFWRPK